MQARDQLARLLTLIPWLARNSPASIDEVAERFGVSRKQLVRELSAVSLVGVPPYTPDTLIEVFFDDEKVGVYLAQPFDRPLRLSPSEALSVFAAAQTMAMLPGIDHDGPLQRALQKLGNSLDLDQNTLQIDVGHAQPDVMAVLRDGVDQNLSVDIDYYSFARDERTTRRVDPYRLSGHGGFWYLQAWCHRANDHRIFRIDRIEEAALTTTHFKLIETFVPLDEFVPHAESPVVTLEVTNSAFRTIENLPYESHDATDIATQRVSLRVAGEAWLARVLLSLGKDAKIVDGPKDLLEVDRSAAERIINRYRKTET